jgi:hypothetical protein
MSLHELLQETVENVEVWRTLALSLEVPITPKITAPLLFKEL